jgi:hypothetical protein
VKICRGRIFSGLNFVKKHGFSTFLRGCNPAFCITATKSVHYSGAKNKTIFTKPKIHLLLTAKNKLLKRKALFIINPISGGKKKDGVPELIGNALKAR